MAAFTSGGTVPTVSAYRWNAVGGVGSLSTSPMATGGKCGSSPNLCAITNETASVTTPWQTTNKASQGSGNKTGQGTTLGPDQFYEGGIDLTANHLDTDSSGNPICVNKFVFDTRSSQSLTATLFDYAEGNVQTCASPKIATNLFLKQAVPPDTSLAPPNNTVTLPASVYDAAGITGALGTPSGTVTYSLWTKQRLHHRGDVTHLHRWRQLRRGDDRGRRDHPTLAALGLRHAWLVLVEGRVLRRWP